MEIVNPKTSFSWWPEYLDINNVPLRGIPEKQGWSFSAHGYHAVKNGMCGKDQGDVVGAAVRDALRPLSKPTLQKARSEYERSEVIDFPRYFIWEPVGGICGRKCPFCSINVISRPSGKGMMSWEHFVKLMQECSEHEVYGASLYMLGEPMYYKGKDSSGKCVDIADMVNVSKSIGGFKAVNISTFGDVNNLHRLLECDVDDVIISIDGTTREVYLENRPPTNPKHTNAFESTLERVHEFLSARSKTGKLNPAVRLQCINKENTAAQIVDFIRYWIAVDGVDSVFIKNLDSMRSWLPGIVSNEEDAVKAKLVEHMPCQHIYMIGAMNWDGTFAACCHDARSELIDYKEENGKRIPISISNSSFGSWWNGHFMVELRKEHAQQTFRIPCLQCRERDVWL